MAEAEKERLLKLLEENGRAFLDSFPSVNANKKRTQEDVETSATPSSKKAKRDAATLEEEEEEEWCGISHRMDGSEDDEDDDEEAVESDFEHTDDEFTGGVDEKVVVFSEPVPKKAAAPDYVSKAQMKAFMSSKISKISNASDVNTSKKTKEEEDEERTNAQNDALLHKLVHTKLLSGSLNPEMDMTPAQRRKALAGRILELTGEAKLGKGEKSVREAEKLKAAKRVREGLSQKQQQRREQELEEAKNLGNYHPTLKKVFEASGAGQATRKRQKGLKMGIGKFTNGSLRLGREDIDAVVGGGARRGFSNKGGRGRDGGGRGKRR
ncbi:hypothetical protein CPC08DRAFT_757219 [Agrocybe pediades]|nr:hypothetical protein CPC08DRAFT_757219 [Agrocybe pediades]